jgi:hypothetical protein
VTEPTKYPTQSKKINLLRINLFPGENTQGFLIGFCVPITVVMQHSEGVFLLMLLF